MTVQPTTRTDALYEYLKGRDGEWTLQRDVYFALRGVYPPLDGRTFHDSTARRQMSADVQAINDSSEYEDIIIHSENGLKIATRTEAAAYVRSRINEAVRQLAQARTLKQKIGGFDVRMEV